jgi:hypothetical protein
LTIELRLFQKPGFGTASIVLQITIRFFHPFKHIVKNAGLKGKIQDGKPYPYHLGTPGRRDDPCF